MFHVWGRFLHMQCFFDNKSVKSALTSVYFDGVYTFESSGYHLTFVIG